MKVYIATAFSMWRAAQAARTMLEEAGHEVTSRWIDVAASFDGKEPPNMRSSERREHAEGDLEDLDEADTMILLVPPKGGTGCWIELGWSMAQGKPVVAVGDVAGRSVFGELVPTAINVRVAVHMLGTRLMAGEEADHG